jgi:WD40 repeat protein
MRASAIRCMAASNRSSRLAAAFFERQVQIWDAEKAKCVNEFETVFSFGGPRLTLDPVGERCIAAAWQAGEHGGVACYETNKGKLIWHRQELRGTQRVRFSPGGESVWCVPDSGPTKLLDAASGKTLDALTGLRDIFDSEYSPDLLLEKRKRDYILRKEKTLQIPRLTSAILDVAFGPQSLAMSEAGGPVRCINSFTGIELWRHSPGKHIHFLKLWYRQTDRNFYGVQWEFQKGSFRSLVRFDANGGEPNMICQLNSWEEVHCPKLDCIVTSSGAVLDLSDGRLLSRLQFPETDYPDRSKSSELPTV